MSHDPIRIFYAIAFALIVWWLLLAIFARSERTRSMPLVTWGCGAVAIVVCFVPLRGLPLWQSAYGVWTNPSLPLLGLVCAALGQRVFGISLLRPVDRRAAWGLGAVAGAILYLHPYFFGALDLYYWGWDRRVAIAGIAVLTILFLAARSRLGLLLFAVFIAYLAGILESTNAWDYLIDPFYWMIGVTVLAKAGIARSLNRRPAARDQAKSSPIRAGTLP